MEMMSQDDWQELKLKCFSNITDAIDNRPFEQLDLAIFFMALEGMTVSLVSETVASEHGNIAIVGEVDEEQKNMTRKELFVSEYLKQKKAAKKYFLENIHGQKK